MDNAQGRSKGESTDDEAGLGSVVLLHRRQSVIGMLLCSTTSAWWALNEIFLEGDSVDFALTRLAASGMLFIFAAACSIPRWQHTMQPWLFELLLMAAFVLWSSSLVYGLLLSPENRFESYQMVLAYCLPLMYMLLTGPRPCSCAACMLIHVLNHYAVVWIGTGNMPKERGNFWLTLIGQNLFTVFIVLGMMHQQVGRTALHRAHQELEAEQEASMSLLSMTCDAGFWLAADGETVVRGDHRLDSLMCGSMENQRLTESLSHSDQQRFRIALAGSNEGNTSSAKLRALPKLLHVTLLPKRGSPVKVDLFVVDRRLAFAGRHGSNPQVHMGFLIGLRLDDSELSNIASPAGNDLEHAENLDREISLAQVRRGPSSRSSPWCLRALPSYEAADGDTGSSCSRPTTLASLALERLYVQVLRREELVPKLVRAAEEASNFPREVLEETVRGALALCCDHALGGALILVAPSENFKKVFRHGVDHEDTICDKSDINEVRRVTTGPALMTSDGGYMTERLRGVHISDERFVAAFREFTEHSDTDCWPQGHPHPEARSKPKDGAFILNVSGYRLKCAAKLLGLAPVRSWQGVGTKHEAALACTWAVDGCVAIVRSDSGIIHALVREGLSLSAFRVLDIDETPRGDLEAGGGGLGALRAAL